MNFNQKNIYNPRHLKLELWCNNGYWTVSISIKNKNKEFNKPNKKLEKARNIL